MSSLQIRDVPPEIYEALAVRARKEHRSLAQQALFELGKLPELQAREQRLRTLQRVRADLEGGECRRPRVPPEVLVRQDRDRSPGDEDGSPMPLARGN